MNKKFLIKIKKNFIFNLGNYDQFSASKYWKKSILKKKKLFKKIDLANFRKNGLANNIDDFYLTKNESLSLFEELKRDCGNKFILRFLESKNYGNAKKIYKFKNKYFTPTDLFIIKYVDELNKKLNLKKINLICEIGQGYGLLASKLLKIKKFKMILIDLPESNLITAYYLKKIYPNKKIIMDIDLKDQELTKKDLKKGDIFIISPWTTVKDVKADLFINSRSMMEMTIKSIKKYFDLIQNNIHKSGYFLCINRYYKDLVGYPIELHLYPFDNNWKVVISKKSWMQSSMHFLLVRRVAKKNDDIRKALNKIKEEYLKILSIEKFIVRRYLPISIYRYYKYLKNLIT
jgi:putative sugar O-methyltransferase